MKTRSIYGIIKFVSEVILATIFIYTSMVKLFDFTGWTERYGKLDIVHDFHLELGVYFIPVVELIVAAMFFIDVTKKVAAWSALALMFVFTGYIYYKIYVWEDSLCPCGGIFSQLTLDKHLWVNLFLLCVALFLVVSQNLPKTKYAHQGT